MGFTQRGQALAQIADPGDVVVAAAVGAVGYYSDLEVLDQHGLVTKEVAYRPIPAGPLKTSPGHDKHVEPEFFAKYEPRFLFARAVQGKLAAGRMKDTLDQWEIDVDVMDRYAPRTSTRSPCPARRSAPFLLVVRLLVPGEDPAVLWNEFPRPPSPAQRRAAGPVRRRARRAVVGRRWLAGPRGAAGLRDRPRCVAGGPRGEASPPGHLCRYSRLTGVHRRALPSLMLTESSPTQRTLHPLVGLERTGAGSCHHRTRSRAGSGPDPPAPPPWPRGTRHRPEPVPSWGSTPRPARGDRCRTGCRAESTTRALIRARAPEQHHDEPQHGRRRCTARGRPGAEPAAPGRSSRW